MDCIPKYLSRFCNSSMNSAGRYVIYVPHHVSTVNSNDKKVFLISIKGLHFFNKAPYNLVDLFGAVAYYLLSFLGFYYHFIQSEMLVIKAFAETKLTTVKKQIMK